jgi:sucrose-6-phosphate hydrolase SacC (GH32 family)
MQKFIKNIYKGLTFLIVIMNLFCCSPEKKNTENLSLETESLDSTNQQPNSLAYHFRPKENRMNDTNGLVYYQGEYHLFFQYNPKGTQWGNMSWGHAISPDLVHWEELPVAIEMEKDSTMIYSGSAVADPNSSGLCEGDSCLVAIYTARLPGLQNQDIAVSNDNGRTFSKFENNPVIDLKMADFRDPKVFWYEKDKKWMMAVALPHEKKIQFYSSKNLIDWKLLSAFGPQGDTTGIWECPDLFELPVENAGGNKWVLLVSFNGDKGSDMQYFIGEFDGTRFINDNPADRVLS